MTYPDWQARTDRNMLEARASLLGQIREFFAERQVLEVDTPILSAAAGTEPNLAPFCIQPQGKGDAPLFLQTSPEFAMKRLLASGSGAIYQLAKSFRHHEAGSQHNPEFTMLEWYRPDFTLAELMDEVEALVSAVLALEKTERISYAELFQRHLQLDPFTATLDTLQQVAGEHIDIVMESSNPDHWLDLLFSHCIQPQLQAPVFIMNYPVSQAALAKVEKDEHGRLVARRFELVVAGLELANGYDELTDAAEQKRRFDGDLALRKFEGKPRHPVDLNLLAALEHTLPECSGVALGVDRLLMLKTASKDIREVISFPIDIA